MIKIYNTLTGHLDEFKPLKENEVSMYVCGPTVYNYIHIGNARPAIFFDTVRRYLEYRGYKVTYIEDATASVNNDETYEMKDLDIVDFIGCILDWSGQVEVLYLDEFEK